MNLELTNIKNLGTVWLWLGMVTLALNLAVVGINRWEFSYGLVYTLGFLAVGIMLSSEKSGLLSGICAAFIGIFSVLIQVTLADVNAATSYAILSVVLFIVVLLNEMGYIEWGEKSTYAKYATLVAFVAWFIYPFTYFWQRVSLGLPLNLETIMFHGGVMLLSGLDFLTFAGTIKFKEYYTIRALLVCITILGAVLLTAVLGWGLTLTPLFFIGG